MSTLQNEMMGVVGCIPADDDSREMELPELDIEELVEDARVAKDLRAEENLKRRGWLIAAGMTLHRSRWLLKRTGGVLKSQYAKERAAAEAKVDLLKEGAVRWGIDWERMESSAFIARIQKCPLPDPGKPATTEVALKEMWEIVRQLTSNPHHRQTRDGNPGVPLYRYADEKDKVEVEAHKKKHGRPPVGYWNYRGQWLVPNPDPLTGGLTPYQRAVGKNFGNTLLKFRKGLRALKKSGGGVGS